MRNRGRGALVTTAVVSYFVDLVFQKKNYGAKIIFEKKKKFSPYIHSLQTAIFGPSLA